MVRPPYGAAVRLCGIAADRWEEIDAAYYQINLLRVPPYRFVGLVYAWAIERVQHDKMDQWLADLNDLLPWQDGESEATREPSDDQPFSGLAFKVQTDPHLGKLTFVPV